MNRSFLQLIWYIPLNKTHTVTSFFMECSNSRPRPLTKRKQQDRKTTKASSSIALRCPDFFLTKFPDFALLVPKVAVVESFVFITVNKKNTPFLLNFKIQLYCSRFLVQKYTRDMTGMEKEGLGGTSLKVHLTPKFFFRQNESTYYLKQFCEKIFEFR